MAEEREQRLDKLFVAYRAACPDPEAAANFMPGMWQKIEARRNPVLQWVTMSRRALAGAVALCLLLAIAMTTALSNSQFYQSTYVEELDAHQVTEDMAAMLPVSSDGGAADRR